LDTTAARHRHDLNTLVQEAQRASTARERERVESEIILGCRPMAWGLAHRYANRGADTEDLRAVADLAVLGAARRFDPARGDFIPYASVTVLGEIKKYFRDYCWTIRPTRSVQDLQSRLATAEIELQHAGAPVTVAGLAQQLGVEPNDVREASVARSCFTPVSLDAPSLGDADAPGVDIGIEDGGYVLSEDRLVAAQACAGLSIDERRLLHLRFFSGLTQTEMAEELGCTQVQVSRSLRRVLDRLRAAIGPDEVQEARAG
jgi:RNA polymerase sigma-B factor